MIIIYIWLLGIYFIFFTIMTYINLIYFGLIPKKYGVKYIRTDGIAIVFLPSREIIEKTIAQNPGHKAEKALKKLLRLNSFVTVIRNIFLGLLLILIIWTLIIIF